MRDPRDPLRGIDKIIADAQQEGKFEDLEGKGRPLVIDTSPDAVVKGLLKEANVDMAPEWIRLAMEIDRQVEQTSRVLEAYAAEYAADRAEIEQYGAAATSPGAIRPAKTRDEPVWRRWRRVFLGWLTGPPPPSAARGVQREQQVARFRQRWEDTLARYASLLHECNRKIRRFNLVVPLANRQHPLLNVSERLEAFSERFPQLARTEDGTLQVVRGPVPVSLLSPPPEEEDAGKRQRDVLQVAALQQKLRRGRQPPPIG
jgi:hypothetical protein